jgi:hypothetical protein
MFLPGLLAHVKSKQQVLVTEPKIFADVVVCTIVDVNNSSFARTAPSRATRRVFRHVMGFMGLVTNRFDLTVDLRLSTCSQSLFGTIITGSLMPEGRVSCGSTDGVMYASMSWTRPRAISYGAEAWYPPMIVYTSCRPPAETFVSRPDRHPTPPAFSQGSSKQGGLLGFRGI